MSRLTPLAPEEFAPELRDALGPQALDRPELLGSFRVWARRPDLAMALLGFRNEVARSTTLPPRLVELVRLRTAFHNQCRSCMVMRSADATADGLSEEVVCQLSHPQEATDLTPRERAALEYADRIATAHHDVDDALFHRLEGHFTDAEIIELGLHVAFFIGFGRIAMSWDLVDDLPDALREEGTVAPWDADGATHVR